MEMHSYKEFPLRVAELGIIHRNEKSGALHGLARARLFTQDDAHIYMTYDQLKDEIINVITLFEEVYAAFGLDDFKFELSTRPENSIGTEEEWNLATGYLQQALDEMGREYKVNEGDGAFYGPKIDFHIKDCMGRSFQCGTIQCDMQMPERFDLTYVGADGAKHRPVMIHRACFGSIERFIAILTEHCAGWYPFWLTPIQIMVIPIAERHAEAAQNVLSQLNNAGLRAEADLRNEKMGFKIREAQLQKIPVMLVLGDKEVEENKVSVRTRENGDEGQHSLDDLIAKWHTDTPVMREGI
jgi:threonyl-tRNA synthetase